MRQSEQLILYSIVSCMYPIESMADTARIPPPPPTLNKYGPFPVEICSQNTMRHWFYFVITQQFQEASPLGPSLGTLWGLQDSSQTPKSFTAPLPIPSSINVWIHKIKQFTQTGQFGWYQSSKCKLLNQSNEVMKRLYILLILFIYLLFCLLFCFQVPG